VAPDLARPVKVGVFVVPDATDPDATVADIIAADRSGLDLVGVQDHPYQRRFFDTWTLLAYVAGRTERIRLVPDVINLPLRLPSVLAKSAASLDVLSGGRVELGIGAGAFWDAIEAMGGVRRTPKESVDALEEAIVILRRGPGSAPAQRHTDRRRARRAARGGDPHAQRQPQAMTPGEQLAPAPVESDPEAVSPGCHVGLDGPPEDVLRSHPCARGPTGQEIGLKA
jgi:alkanesulfonate monooxygenase SsuD/methylene tetrahydromethanopterin reductase-like flavin-dependent oxidoreductase (luciferase family)